jgi:CHAT domain-containing protein
LWLRSVTCGDLGALFEPFHDRDGTVVPGTIDRSRPRPGESATSGAVVRQGAFASPGVADGRAGVSIHRRVAEADASMLSPGVPAAMAEHRVAFDLGSDRPGWERDRPFADPVHWAAFSLIGM